MAHLETSKKRVIFGTPDAELVAMRRLVAICLAAENSFVVRRSVDRRSEVETGSELPLFLSHDRIGHFYIYTGLGGLRHHVIEARPLQPNCQHHHLNLGPLIWADQSGVVFLPV